jgi:hypothetical protein
MTTDDFPIKRNWNYWSHNGPYRDMLVNAVAKRIIADNPDRNPINLCDDFVARCDAIYIERGNPTIPMKIFAIADDVDTSEMHELPE